MGCSEMRRSRHYANSKKRRSDSRCPNEQLRLEQEWEGYLGTIGYSRQEPVADQPCLPHITMKKGRASTVRSNIRPGVAKHPA